MKTPEEIKKGLDCCRGINAPCEGCPYNMETLDYDESVSKLHDDAIAYIQQLEAENAELLKKIEQLKANAERKGFWVVVEPYGWHADGFYSTPKIKCSECGAIPRAAVREDREMDGTILSYAWNKTERCPSCGAKMDDAKCHV